MHDAGNILVVEDEALIAWDVALRVEELGYEVTGPAHSLEDGISMLEDGSPEAAILDINLGKKTVWPLAQKLHDRKVPIVFISASLDPDRIRSDFPTAEMLNKPIGRVELEGALERLGVLKVAP